MSERVVPGLSWLATWNPSNIHVFVKNRSDTTVISAPQKNLRVSVEILFKSVFVVRYHKASWPYSQHVISPGATQTHSLTHVTVMTFILSVTVTQVCVFMVFISNMTKQYRHINENKSYFNHL